MAHITFTEGLPGIRGPMVFSPETRKPITATPPPPPNSSARKVPLATSNKQVTNKR
jgi:hypothetical protein